MIDTSAILWSIVFGSIGFSYFIYGKKQSKPVVRYTGIALIIFPYFVNNTLAMILLGALLLFAPKFIRL